MNRCRIVPAIDLIGGKCVRLEQGDFTRSAVVGDDPLAVAREFARLGFGRLHLVDLDGARGGAPQHLEVLRAITSNTPLAVDYSGGLRTDGDIEAALGAGASQVVIGSAAVVAEDSCRRWFNRFGAERIIIGLDVYQGLVRVKGWLEQTERTIYDVVDRYGDVGLQTVMSTDISCDGMLAGPAFELYAGLRERYPAISLVASGGVRDARDVARLAQCGVSEVIVGKALYSGSLKVSEAKEFTW